MIVYGASTLDSKILFLNTSLPHYLTEGPIGREIESQPLLVPVILSASGHANDVWDAKGCGCDVGDSLYHTRVSPKGWLIVRSGSRSSDAFGIVMLLSFLHTAGCGAHAGCLHVHQHWCGAKGQGILSLGCEMMCQGAGGFQVIPG